MKHIKRIKDYLSDKYHKISNYSLWSDESDYLIKLGFKLINNNYYYNSNTENLEIKIKKLKKLIYEQELDQKGYEIFYRVIINNSMKEFNMASDMLKYVENSLPEVEITAKKYNL